MTEPESRYASLAKGYYAERIDRNAQIHQVSRRMEALACLAAAIGVLSADGDALDLANDVGELQDLALPPDSERTA